jgi:hypothetical protein
MMHTSSGGYSLRTKCLSLLALVFIAPVLSQAQPTSTHSPLTVTGLGKATAPLDGTWQFHIGVDPAWAFAYVPLALQILSGFRIPIHYIHCVLSQPAAALQQSTSGS